jgi:DNA-binding CsgD family transcriptional regulator
MKSLNNLVRSDPPNRSPSWDLSDVAPLIDAIGQPKFAERLLSILEELIGADHCTVYRLREREFEKIASLSRAGARDIPDAGLTAYEFSRHLSQSSADDIGITVERISDLRAASGLRSLQRAQRVVAYGRRHGVAYAIYILRSCNAEAAAPEPFSDEMRGAFRMLLAAIAKHADAHALRPSLSRAFCSLPEMQQFIFASSKLSLREAEVCARILSGHSPCDIAAELEIGKESVITYRKRAFQRLEINSQRELLIWYLERWNASLGAAPKPAWPDAPRAMAAPLEHAHHH